MRSPRLMAAALLLVVAFAPLPGRAGQVRAIDVKNGEFEPRGIGAVAGDTITWTWRSGNHTVTAYQGATFDQQMTGGAFSSFSYNYTGGLILYYCKIHSQVSGTTCSGPMCGRVSDTPPTVEPPTIQSPPNGSTQVNHGFDIWGTVTQASVTKVKVKEGQATLGVANVSGQGWRQYVELSNGQHTITAIAVDEDGFESARSAPVTITVASSVDTKPPQVVITSPKDPDPANAQASLMAFVSDATTPGIVIGGHAIDQDSTIADVSITLTDQFGATHDTDWVCTSCGSDKRVLFVARAMVDPGIYTIQVEAADAAGLQGSASKSAIVVR